MRQRFFSSTIQSSYIKNLLHSVPLPIYKTVDTGDYLIKNNLYVYNKNIILCTRSGYLNRDPQHCDEVDEEDFKQRRIALYQEQQLYTFGEAIPKFTNTFDSKYDFYDSESHERLGKFLRCVRDILKIDLLPFYNVFSGKYQDGLILEDDELIESVNTSAYKTFKVPIEYNKTYTIAIDSDTEVSVGAALIRRNDLLSIEFEPGEIVNLENGTSNVQEDETSDVLYKGQKIPKFYKINVDSYTSTAFKRPFTFRVDNVITYDEEGRETNNEVVDLYNSYERDLYMLIQVSSLNTSSLVVLDGDYTDTAMYDVTRTAIVTSNPSKKTNVVDMENINTMEDVDLNKIFLNSLNLLILSDGTRYPFTDRLVEYLLGNVITSQDEISENVERIQQTMSSYDPFLHDVKTFKQNGVWTNFMRAQLFYNYLNPRTDRDIKYGDHDITGFVDKDIEDFFERKTKK